MDLSLPLKITSVAVERSRALWQHYRLPLGIRGIDAQHAWLVTLILELEWVLLNEEEQIQQRFQEVIAETRRYAEQHFAAEELLMREFHYNEGPAHEKTHQNFGSMIDRIARSVNLADPREAALLQRFLRQWLVHHIRKEDLKYAEFFQRRKLVAQANEFFENSDDPAAAVEPEKYALLELISKKNDLIDVTTPTVIKEISSIWNRLNLRIGVPLIDIQHLWLIKMIVDMDEAMRGSSLTREAVLSQTIAEAAAYIDVHFRTEEALMETIQFAHIDEHKKKHKHFENFVLQRQKEFDGGQSRAAITIVNDLREWLTSHIAIEDREMTAFYEEHKEAALAFSRDRIKSGKAGLRQNQLNLYQLIVQKLAA